MVKKRSDMARKTGIKGKINPKIDPLWKGPYKDGLTQSLISRFLVCRERFRVHAIEGYRPIQTFSKASGFGTMWHLCEEVYEKGGDVREELRNHCKGLIKQFPTDAEKIDFWCRICLGQFDIYLKFWEGETKIGDGECITLEESFSVPYTLPDGRTIRMRGKWDEVLKAGTKRKPYLIIKDHKTKGNIDEVQVNKQLTFDLQTMFYVIALENSNYAGIGPVKELCYNVIRRPISGGKGTIRQKKPTKTNPNGESTEEYVERLMKVISEDPQHFFMRWEALLDPMDSVVFRNRFLNPMLMQICDWWDFMVKCDFNPWNQSPKNNSLHFQYPFGVYNPLDRTGETDVDSYIMTGDKTGLKRAETVFPEL